ncbi:MAG: HEAT repeat domain-containing protein [Phycisphaerae bacterium]|nr:HEAT repeat domain-containing protein [Tepidisphaeraceae bacterium]
MPTPADIQAIVDQFPELDNPPPPPPAPPKKPDAKPEVKPAAGDAKPGEAKPTVPEKATEKPPEKPAPPSAPPGPPKSKGKLTGPTWAEADVLLDKLVAGGPESVAHLIDLIKEPDIGPAHKPRYVLHALTLHTARPGKSKERAALVQAVTTKLADTTKSPSLRGLMIRTLQSCAGPDSIPALIPLLTDAELSDPAAQAIVTLARSSEKADVSAAVAVLRQSLTTTGRPQLAAAQALGYLKDAGAIDALAQLARTASADDRLRATALWSLAQTASPQAIDPILAAVKEAPVGWLRNQSIKAAFALAENLPPTPNAAPAKKLYQALHDLLTDPRDAHFRAAAKAGL